MGQADPWGGMQIDLAHSLCQAFIIVGCMLGGPSQVALVVKNPPASTGDVRDTGLNPWVGKITWRKEWQHTPVFLAREFHGQRQAIVHGVAKSQIEAI